MNIIGGSKGEPSYDEKYYETGIIRLKKDKEFIYIYTKNKKLVLLKDLKRIRELRIPPIWSYVWISGNPDSDIQVVGLDSKGRKQYLYNKKHIQIASQEKFLRMYDFIKAIPKLEKSILKSQELNVYDKKRVISTMLIIVRDLHMRVGKETYAKENKSYGISSLKKTHVKIIGDQINFNFKGKSSQRLAYKYINHDIAEHLKLLLKLHGEKLFQYIDDNNNVYHVTDRDLNIFIQEYMGSKFTIKDFRTYASNFHFIKALLKVTKAKKPITPQIIKKNLNLAIKSAAKQLSHTQSISKKSYIFSFLIEMYMAEPSYFINNVNSNANLVLLDILKRYKEKISK